MYTLWRGGVLLGRFDEREPVTHHGERVGASGILEPTEALSGTASIWQTRMEVLHGRPVFQSPLETLWLGASVESNGADTFSSTVVLKSLSPEEARGIPDDQVLQVRTEDGTIIDTGSVALQLSAIPEEVDPAEVYRVNGVSGPSREFWMVSFVEDHA